MASFLREKLFYGLVLVLAALVNAAGYLLSLWHDETVFDEVVHLFTSFAVLASIGKFLITAKGMRPSATLTAWLLAFALILGIAWEFFEWVIGIIGGRQDTLMDLAMDVAGGALAAALVSSVFAKHLRS